MPAELVMVCRTNPVSRFRTWTVALGIRAPLWSRTVPLICAESYCANSGVLATKPTRERMRAQTKPPPFFKGLASPPPRMESIGGVWLFTVDLPKDDRPRSLTLRRRVVTNAGHSSLSNPFEESCRRVATTAPVNRPLFNWRRGPFVAGSIDNFCTFIHKTICLRIKLVPYRIRVRRLSSNFYCEIR